MPPEFIYFDLGKVLVDVDHELMTRQMADVIGVDAAQVRELVLDDGLQWRYERGHISTPEFYEAICRRTGTRPDCGALLHAASDIFELIPGVVPLVQGLRRAGYRLGILSNTCQAHWEHIEHRFDLMKAFPVLALSYQIKAVKPDPAIFQAAVNLAGVRSREIFFTDDAAANVEGAQSAGLDAVQFTSASQLATELSDRGIDVDLSARPG